MLQIYKKNLISREFYFILLKQNFKSMSRIHELTLNNPSLVINTIEIINSLFNKSKYTELSVNLIKNYRENKQNDYNRIDGLKLYEATKEFWSGIYNISDCCDFKDNDKTSDKIVIIFFIEQR